MLPIKSLVLEGPDCSGKSTLYASFHKATKFSYNLIDRSYLSRVAYARLYGRDVETERAGLQSQLCDANNFIVILLPPLRVVKERLLARGDEFQDATSIESLYNIFEEEAVRLASVPNVLLLRDQSTTEELTSTVLEKLSEYSRQMPSVFGATISRWTSLTPRREVQFKATFDLPTEFSESEEVVLSDPHEGSYYKDIRSKCAYTVKKEIAGKNPYKLPQGLDSRRFYYNSDTCISSIHFLVRDKGLKVLVTLRSTDAVKNGSIDLRFLSYLSTWVPHTFKWNVDKITLDVSFNSLHVRSDVV